MQAWIVPVRLFAYLVIVLMAGAVGYAGYTALKYWPAISV